MRIAIRQVTVDVLLELKPIDHDWRHRFLFLLLFLRFARIGIMDDEDDAF